MPRDFGEALRMMLRRFKHCYQNLWLVQSFRVDTALLMSYFPPHSLQIL